MAQARIAFELVASQWGAPAHVVDAAYVDLVARYGERHRRYHTLEHIEEALRVLTALPPDATLSLYTTTSPGTRPFVLERQEDK